MLPTKVTQRFESQEDRGAAPFVRMRPPSGEPAIDAMLAGEAIPEIPLGSPYMFVGISRVILFSESAHRGLREAIIFRKLKEPSQSDYMERIKREPSLKLYSLLLGLKFIDNLQIQMPGALDVIVEIETLPQGDSVPFIRVFNVIPFSESDHRGIYAAMALRKLTKSRRQKYMKTFQEGQNKIPYESLMSSERFLRDLKPDESTVIHVLGCVDVSLARAYWISACSLTRSLTQGVITLVRSIFSRVPFWRETEDV